MSAALMTRNTWTGLRQRWESARAFLHRWAGAPVTAGFATIVGAGAGLLASVYADVLKRNPPLSLLPDLPDASIVVVIWLSIFLFGMLFWVGQQAQSETTTNYQHELKGNIDDLNTALKTVQELVSELHSLPPPGFLNALHACYEFCSGLDSAKLEVGNNREELLRQIRFLMKSLLSVARAYHRHPEGDDCRYACNIMLFRDSEYLGAMSAEGQKLLEDRLAFCDVKHLKLDACYGVLDLTVELSADESEHGIDVEMRDIAFPILDEPIDRSMLEVRNAKVLPGAPTAQLMGEVVIHSSQKTLLDEVEERDIDKSIQKLIAEQMSSDQGKWVQSFVSLPLAPLEFWDEANEPIGVLNIHRNTDGIFPGSAIERIPALFQPIVRAIVKKLARLEEVDDQSGAAAT